MEITTSNIRNVKNTIIPFPAPPAKRPKSEDQKSSVYESMIEESQRLNLLSKYKSQFDFGIFRALETRFRDKPIHGGIVKKSSLKLANFHTSCQQCLYAFEIDSYGRGCVHNCVYCYAKAQLTVHGMWNNPIPFPIDVNEVRKVFYTVFETDKKTKWRSVMERRVPLRIGSMSDSFMWLDRKYKVTQELLKILNFYKYPYAIFTRSDLAAHDDYISLIDKKLATVQYSISSTNDDLNKLIEPGAPPAYNRLRAIEKLTKAGIWTAVRINPIFPIRPDGFYTDPSFKWAGEVPEFNYTTFEMVNEIADAGTPTIIAGFGRFSSFAINNIKNVSGVDLRPFFKRDDVYKSSRDYHYSDQEIRYYYEEFKRRCNNRKVQFTTCYIGNGEAQFWRDQDLWSNKKDCCNIKGVVAAFKTDSRSIPFAERLTFAGDKSHSPVNPDTIHANLGSSPLPKIKCLETIENLQ